MQSPLSPSRAALAVVDLNSPSICLPSSKPPSIADDAAEEPRTVVPTQVQHSPEGLTAMPREHSPSRSGTHGLFVVETGDAPSGDDAASDFDAHKAAELPTAATMAATKPKKRFNAPKNNNEHTTLMPPTTARKASHAAILTSSTRNENGTIAVVLAAVKDAVADLLDVLADEPELLVADETQNVAVKADITKQPGARKRKSFAPPRKDGSSRPPAAAARPTLLPMPSVKEEEPAELPAEEQHEQQVEQQLARKPAQTAAASAAAAVATPAKEAKEEVEALDDEARVDEDCDLIGAHATEQMRSTPIGGLFGSRKPLHGFMFTSGHIGLGMRAAAPFSFEARFVSTFLSEAAQGGALLVSGAVEAAGDDLPAEGDVPPAARPAMPFKKRKFGAPKAASGTAITRAMPPPPPRSKVKRERADGEDADDEDEEEDAAADEGERGRGGGGGGGSTWMGTMVSLTGGLGGGGGGLLRKKRGMGWSGGGGSADGAAAAAGVRLILCEPWQEGQCALIMDPLLAAKLRPHQSAGCQFIVQACLGRKAIGKGCLLADDMGLGKTLQTIATIHTLLYSCMEPGKSKGLITTAAVICPTSLVHNWRDEVAKWTEGLPRKLNLTVLTSDMKDDIEAKLVSFRALRTARLLILSYDTARLHVETLRTIPLGLLVCDEAHKLKNLKTALFQALFGLPTQMRLMVTGTPIQNGLEEFFALLHFCIPDGLGSEKEFQTKYGKAIEKARDLEATDAEIERGSAASSAFIAIVNQLMLRRSNEVIAKYLPAKLDVLVFCSLTGEQQAAYTHEVTVGRAAWQRAAKTGEKAQQNKTALRTVAMLKKIVNDPLAAKSLAAAEARATEAAAVTGGAGGGVGGGVSGKRVLEALEARQGVVDVDAAVAASGKLRAMRALLREVKRTTDDRFVLISNSTSILDLFDAVLSKERLRFMRLDGSLAANKRQERVDAFNTDPSIFAFLLSSKAGGCGINLIGANRLILFDPDWNPAIDAQALARVWRSGQQKPCYVYRLFAVRSLSPEPLRCCYHASPCICKCSPWRPPPSATLLFEGGQPRRGVLGSSILEEWSRGRDCRRRGSRQPLLRGRAELAL